jgi:hypothetical protein
MRVFLGFVGNTPIPLFMVAKERVRTNESS